MAQHSYKDPQDLIYSNYVVEFITVANEFCKLVENVTYISREKFIENTYKILVLLQLKAIMLPKIEPDLDYETESFVTEQDWYIIDTGVSNKLGSLETFSELREPANPESPFEISLSECIADTYQDLKDFIMLYQIGNNEATFLGLNECKNNFEQIWGPRIMLVIREFHNLLHGDTEIADENGINDSDEDDLNEQLFN
jgi:hypothetical protein